MKLEVKIELLKFWSHVFNTVFLVLGLSVAGCAVWILFSSGSLLNVLALEEVRIVGMGLLLIGGVVALVSVIGFIGTDRENRILLLMYLGFLIVLLLGQLFITLLLLINRDKIDRTLDETVDHIILQYGRDSDSDDRLMDRVQNYGKCCGRTGPADWLKNPYIQNLTLTSPDVLPCSCFRSSHPIFDSPWCSELLNLTTLLLGTGNSSYDQGCGQRVSEWLQENALTIVGMDVGLMFIQVLQFAIMVHLYRTLAKKAFLKKATHPTDSDRAHLDLVPEGDLDFGEQNYVYIDPSNAYTDPSHQEHYYD